MQDTKDRTTREKCNSKEAENTHEKSSSTRDKELDSIRQKQKKDNELEKDMFDVVVELGGLGT